MLSACLLAPGILRLLPHLCKIYVTLINWIWMALIVERWIAELESTHSEVTKVYLKIRTILAFVWRGWSKSWKKLVMAVGYSGCTWSFISEMNITFARFIRVGPLNKESVFKNAVFNRITVSTYQSLQINFLPQLHTAPDEPFSTRSHFVRVL